MDKRVIQLGCKDCVHGYNNRCNLKNHKMPWPVNAPYHCKEFAQYLKNPAPVSCSGVGP
jgi:hypothetical protein